jgi:hypothetical protein
MLEIDHINSCREEKLAESILLSSIRLAVFQPKDKWFKKGISGLFLWIKGLTKNTRELDANLDWANPTNKLAKSAHAYAKFLIF